jgi:hypothetical protein
LTAKPGFSVVSCSVGCDGSALRLLVPNDLANLAHGREQRAGFASFPLTRSEREYDAVLEVTNSYASYEIEFRDLVNTFPFVQLLPADKPLIVSPRCARHKDGTHELNAKVYDAKGKLEREFLLGDGIQHLQVDRRGRIWVGYFDEGVYGNFGWGGSGAAAPVGAAGLLCFTEQGEQVWEYKPVSGTDSISDLYALNVFGDEAWASYYTGFPVIRVGSDWKVEAWTTKVPGARALAVGHGKILLLGGYDDQTASRCLHLADKQATIEYSLSLSLTEGGNLADATVIGRGHILHIFAGEVWYQFSTALLP